MQLTNCKHAVSVNSFVGGAYLHTHTQHSVHVVVCGQGAYYLLLCVLQ